MTRLKPFTPLFIAFFLLVASELFLSFPPVCGYLIRIAPENLSLKLKELESKKRQDYDVLFLGSSRTHYGFATTEFEKGVFKNVSSYDLGVFGADYKLTGVILEGYLKTHRPPKLILLELNDFSVIQPPDPGMGYYPVVNYVSIIHNVPGSQQMILATPLLSVQNKMDIMLSAASRFYLYRDIISPTRLVDIAKNLVNHKKPPPLESNEINGWVGAQKKVPITPQAARIKLGYNWGANPMVNADSLHAMLVLCKEKNIPVVMVQWPTHPYYHDLVVSSAQYAGFLSAVQTTTREYQVPLIDFEDTGEGRNPDLFFDPDHLSRDGAIYYTGILKQRLLMMDLIHKIIPNLQKEESNGSL